MALHKLAVLLKAIRFEHTAFALPFALTATFVAANGWPRAGKLGWILVAMVGARTAAMAFNRIADVDLDRENPRTAKRALVTGELSKGQLWLTLFAAAGAYFLASGMLNWICLALSPVALAVLLGYSVTKRFTVLSHWILGFALGLAPVGAWVAIRGRIAWPEILAPAVLCLAVTTWTAGFDIIYACQDITFDRKKGLFSLPARWGAKRALVFSALNHVFTVWFLTLFGTLAGLGWLYYLGVVLLIPVLWFEHRVVQPDDLSRAELASFVANGVFSVVFFVFAATDEILLSRIFRI